MTPAFTESKRVKVFRLGIARKIPRFPNDKETLQKLVLQSENPDTT